MTSISGKADIDRAAYADALSPVKTITEPALIKKRSRDFFWYSTILNAALKKCFGDLVALPETPDEMAHTLATAIALRCAHCAARLAVLAIMDNRSRWMAA